MPFMGVPGFFGKLPAAGDFVQRRLPPSFVEAWDTRFEQAVAESRNALGNDWSSAYQCSPTWRFVMAPRIGSGSGWAGVMGPGADRVGRCFPMVIAAELSPDPMACGEALSRYRWFDRAAEILTDAQRDPSGGVDAFDARVTSLNAVAAEPLADPRDLLDRTDWKTATHWRLPLPTASVFSAKYLSILWSRLGAGNWCLWWTEGAGRVPASIFVTAGLPHPQAYAGFLDAAHAGAGWQKLGVFPVPASSIKVSTPPATPAPVPPPKPMAPPPSPARVIDPDATQPMRRPMEPPVGNPELARALDDLSDLLAATPAAHSPIVTPRTAVQTPLATAPEPVPERAPSGPFSAVLRRTDCAVTAVASDGGGGDLGQRIAASALALVREIPSADFGPGLQVLRESLLALHVRLQTSGGDLVNPAVPADCALAAVRIAGGQASALRIGAASIWRWRRGQLQPLFIDRSASADEDTGDDLDDLLFSGGKASPAGLGSAAAPLCEMSACAVQGGDRILLAASRRLQQLSPDMILRGLAMPSRDEAAARIAAAAGLGPNARIWPVAVIEVGS